MDCKKIVRRLLWPHPAFTAVFSPCALALLVYSSLFLEPTAPFSIASYVLSFCALTLTVLRIPDVIRFIRRFRRENRYIVRYSADLRLRTTLSLRASLIFNAAYAVFQLGLGIFHRSAWFYSMAGYYCLLAFMKFLLSKHTARFEPGAQPEAEWRRHRLCGVCLLLTTLTLSIFIIYFVWKIRVFRHHEITTIAMAAFTFASLTMAAVNAFRSRNSASPVLTAVRSISLAAALVSVLTLENAMLTAFGQETDELFRRIMLSLTGAAVVTGVQIIAIRMIAASCRSLRILRTAPSDKTGADKS